jgi:Zn-dependent peptidase ImmA (M78 family)
MRNNSLKKSNIKKLAEAIASYYDNLITPLEEIIKDEELDVFYDSYNSNSFDGMTIFDNNKFYIHLNLDSGNKNNSPRGRFTLAHELGHYFIDSHRIGLKNGILTPHPSKTNQKQHIEIEREADYFASCLLMPEIRFRREVKVNKFSFKVIDDLRLKFNVSITACAFRVADLSIHPIMIIYAENNIIKWKHESNDFPYKWLINGNNVPKNTVMGEYFNKRRNEDIHKTEVIWAIDCFNGVHDDDLQRKFYEYCIPYKTSALSIIWED